MSVCALPEHLLLRFLYLPYKSAASSFPLDIATTCQDIPLRPLQYRHLSVSTCCNIIQSSFILFESCPHPHLFLVTEDPYHLFDLLVTPPLCCCPAHRSTHYINLEPSPFPRTLRSSSNCKLQLYTVHSIQLVAYFSGPFPRLQLQLQLDLACPFCRLSSLPSSSTCLNNISFPPPISIQSSTAATTLGQKLSLELLDLVDRLSQPLCPSSFLQQQARTSALVDSDTRVKPIFVDRNRSLWRVE